MNKINKEIIFETLILIFFAAIGTSLYYSNVSVNNWQFWVILASAVGLFVVGSEVQKK